MTTKAEIKYLQLSNRAFAKHFAAFNKAVKDGGVTYCSVELLTFVSVKSEGVLCARIDAVAYGVNKEAVASVEKAMCRVVEQWYDEDGDGNGMYQGDECDVHKRLVRIALDDAEQEPGETLAYNAELGAAYVVRRTSCGTLAVCIYFPSTRTEGIIGCCDDGWTDDEAADAAFRVGSRLEGLTRSAVKMEAMKVREGNGKECPAGLMAEYLAEEEEIKKNFGAS